MRQNRYNTFMAKNIAFILSLSLVCACAGNPPAWWNPSGVYDSSTAPQQQQAAVQPSLPPSAAAEEEEPYPAEQTIEPAMESYEELDLSPFAQTVEVSAEPMQSTAQETQSAQASSAASQQETASSVQEELPPAEVEENLPQDGSLPPPSVLF